jgi:two-component system sensor histidine kinase CpxA
MYRAVDNVIRNAIRHSPPKGAVKVAVSTDGDFARIVVEDEGPGVPAADLERIFEAFYRVSKARERQTGGAGLGLALTSRVATLHGGCVLARNRLPQGLCVIITLPVGNFTL